MPQTTHTDPFVAKRGNGQRKGSQPLLHQPEVEVQKFGEMRLFHRPRS